MENALLQQKVEFLEMELEEVKRREENLKRVNHSLMQAINNEPSILKDQTLSELQKANEQYLNELTSLKKKYKEQLSLLEKQTRELFLSKKELQIDLKHQKTSAESEKYELLGIIKQLESEKLDLEKSFRKKEEDDRNNTILYEKNSKEYLNPLKFKQSLEKSFGETRSYHNKENDILKGQLENLMSKLKSKKEKIKRLKDRNNEKTLRIRIEELEEELETYKLICKKQTTSSKQQETEKKLKQDLDDALNTIEKLKKVSGEKKYNDLKTTISKKDLEIRELKEKINYCNLEIERFAVELNKSTLKLQQNEIYWAMSDEKRSETEIALKNEIKFLIGKLLKAKSKVGPDTDANESIVKKELMATVRSKSVKKSLGPVKSISPLNLSVITRSDSPFCGSHNDL
jgi:hypothetical protein